MNIKLKIGTIILLVTVIVIGGLIILNKQKSQGTAIQLQEITVQPENTSCLPEFKEKADYLSLSCDEFIVLSTTVREYLYQRYPFLSKTDFGIRYERTDIEVKNIPTKAIIIDAFANFRTPPVVITVVFYEEEIYFLSIDEVKEMP